MSARCFGRPIRDNQRRLLGRLLGVAAILGLLAGCAGPVAPTSPPPTSTPPWVPTAVPTTTPGPAGLTDEEVATLGSLERVDGYPLYTMRYYGAYDTPATMTQGNAGPASSPWACSLFAALGDADRLLYGRNFDWDYSPALLLFTDPPDGYASVSMVDIAYLGFGGSGAATLTDLPLASRRALLGAPFLPFDGMNEHGLVVAMAAVPASEMPFDRTKESIDSLLVIREILDHARSVDEALAILRRYNIDWGGGPPLHYLIAAPPGQAVLVEFYRGEMVVIPNEAPWHVATNFLRSAAGESAQGECWRYDRISQRLGESGGRMTGQEAMGLLAEVSQEGTQWSVVYGMSAGEVTVSMGRRYDRLHAFDLTSIHD